MSDTRKYTEAQKKSAKKWDAVNLDRLSIALPKGSREAIKAHAATLGESANAFIKRAIDNQIAQDSSGTAPESTAGAGVVSLPSDTLKTVQEAAQATGETVPQFVERAVETQAQRDKSSLRMGLNPVTGDKLERGT